MPKSGAESTVYADMEAKLRKQFDSKPALYWIAIGDKDFLYEANSKYRKLLDDNHWPYTYYETSDGHIWKNWRIYLTEFVPMLFRKK